MFYHWLALSPLAIWFDDYDFRATALTPGAASCRLHLPDDSAAAARAASRRELSAGFAQWALFRWIGAFWLPRSFDASWRASLRLSQLPCRQAAGHGPRRVGYLHRWARRAVIIFGADG